MQEVEIKAYRTEDGEVFIDRRSAEAHEAGIQETQERERTLSEYRIPDQERRLCMPGFLHGDTPRLLDRGYAWYAVPSKEAASEIAEALTPAGVRLIKMPECFPTVLGYNSDRHSQFWLYDLEALADEAAGFVRELKVAAEKKDAGRNRLQKGMHKEAAHGDNV